MWKDQMEDAKEKPAVQSREKVWDRVFKIMMQEQSALFIPLINLVFKKHYEHDVPIININTEAYNKDKSRIMSDISFLIENKTYHFECQYSDDQKMAFRMFEYDFHIALADAKMTNNFTEFNSPRSCVFYIVPKESIPDKLEMQVNFEEESYTYKVPVIRLYDYDLDKIEENELFLFLPYEILRHVRNVTTEKHIEEYAEEINSVYSKIIDILEKAYNESKIKGDEILTLMNMLNDTAEYKLKDYPQIWKGVNEMLNREYMPKWKVELELAKEETVKEVTRTTEIDMLKLMKENGIPEKQIRAIAKQKKVSMKTVDDILNFSETKKAVRV